MTTVNVSGGITRTIHVTDPDAGMTQVVTVGLPGTRGLKGDPGVDGKSAYELAVEAGFVGTEAAWLDSLQGADGQDGLPGTTTWAGITDKPTIPDSADDIGAETPAGAQAKADAAEAAANAYTDTALTGVGGGAVDSVNGQTGVVVLDAADVSARPDTYVPTWAEVTGKPTIPTTPGEVGADPAGSAAAAQAAAATDATTKANTAEANAKAASTPIAHATDTTNPHAVTKAQVGLGSVDNVSAASLRDRTTHTGTQAATTITGLAAVATSGAYADLSGKPTISSLTVQDENGTVATGVTQIDFQGAGVTASAGTGEVVVTVAGGGAGGGGVTYFRSVLTADFTSTVTGTIITIPGLGFSITPAVDGVLTISGRMMFQNSGGGDFYEVGAVISPAPVAGTAKKISTVMSATSNKWQSVPFSGAWKLSAGTAYTVSTTILKGNAGTLLVGSGTDYTELTGTFQIS